MKIYVSSSWKISQIALDFAQLLRKWGHEVHCYAEHEECKYVWPDVVTVQDDGITCLDTNASRKAFKSDKDGMDWAECCIMINPSGRDAHLEAGYMKGQDKKLYIVGDFPKGEFSNMYHLADELFRLDESSSINYLRECLQL